MAGQGNKLMQEKPMVVPQMSMDRREIPMKKAIWGLFILWLFLFGSMAAADTGVFQIKELQTFDSRVKLREQPTKNGTVMGQYYAGPEVRVLGGQGDWANVVIGDATGFMMREFLATGDALSPTMGEILPDDTGSIPVWDRNGKEIGSVLPGTIQVLGTVDDMTLHVALPDSYPFRYGYVSAEKVKWVGGRASVDAGDASGLVRVREKPSSSAAVLFQLYSGVEVSLIFDNHTAGDGWARVRVGNRAGYIMEKFLDLSSDGVRYRPQWGRLNRASAPITASSFGEVMQEDILFLLGTAGNRNTPLYLASVTLWDERRSVYRTDSCCVFQSYVDPAGEGSIPVGGKIRTDCQAYYLDADGKLVSIREPGMLPAGTTVTILDGILDSLVPAGWNGYLTEDTRYVLVDAEMNGTTLSYVLVPIEALEYDPRLMLPGEFTNG